MEKAKLHKVMKVKNFATTIVGKHSGSMRSHQYALKWGNFYHASKRNLWEFKRNVMPVKLEINEDANKGVFVKDLKWIMVN